MQSPIEIFMGLTPWTPHIRLMQEIKFRELSVVNEARVQEILDIKAVHASLIELHRNVEERNNHRRTCVPGLQNAKMKVCLINIFVTDYGMISTSARRQHN